MSYLKLVIFCEKICDLANIIFSGGHYYIDEPIF